MHTSPVAGDLGPYPGNRKSGFQAVYSVPLGERGCVNKGEAGGVGGEVKLMEPMCLAIPIEGDFEEKLFIFRYQFPTEYPNSLRT